MGDGDAAQWVSVLAFDPEVVEVTDKLVTGARVYIEGKLTVTEWTGRNGDKRQGLNVMSWRCRLPHIGRNKPKKTPSEDPAPRERERTMDDLNDEVPF